MIRIAHMINSKYSHVFIFFFVLSIGLQLFSMQSVSQESSLVIDAPQIVESETNFTVSVYNPNITIGTPYLVDVTVVFDNSFYQITPLDENGEIIIQAPKVHVNKTYLIEAFYKNKSGNNTILVIPRQNEELKELVITPDVYSVESYASFSVLVTDKQGNPIENVTVSIKNFSANEYIDVTNSEGYAILETPNTEIMYITAYKDGYVNATKSLSVITKKDTFSELLSNPQTPVIFSLSILIVVIFYVSVSGRKGKDDRSMYSWKLKVKKDQSKHSDKTSNTTKQFSSASTIHNRLEPIRTTSQSISNGHTESHPQNNTSENNFIRWFTQSPEQTNVGQELRNKDDELLEESDDIHKRIDRILSKKKKEKKHHS